MEMRGDAGCDDSLLPATKTSKTTDTGVERLSIADSATDFAETQSELRRRHSTARRMSMQINTSMLHLPQSISQVASDDAADSYERASAASSRQPPTSRLQRFVEASGVNLLREPIFIIPFLANLFAMTGLYIPFYFIPNRAMALGVSQTWAAFLVSIIGE
jgi:hypothetical protein